MRLERRRQIIRTRTGDHEPTSALALLIHGDAAFPAQGVVAETLNLQDLPGYWTGGTLHLIANNQIGFTTEPAEARSTRYSSDLAKGFDCPIIHVNADDPEAALAAVRLAMAYRERFRDDVVVDLIGYRRFGHNEQDEPAYTQPLMVKAIERHATVVELYARALVEGGTVAAGAAPALVAETEHRLRDIHQTLKASLAAAPHKEPVLERQRSDGPETGVSEALLRELDADLLETPEEFHLHPKLARQLERRRRALGPDGRDRLGPCRGARVREPPLEGVPIRLTGQDTERGRSPTATSSFTTSTPAARWTPIQHVRRAAASFELHNSPLSEFAALGFEYGYSVAVQGSLVLWEAQFGDFVNNAQAIIDQFLVSGYQKWQQTSRLTLLLPHGYEGGGPEHSSARVERFLQLAAQGNMRIANCSTPAQYFHLLRLQALGSMPRPLVLFTPKSLLRLPQAASRLDELIHGSFRPMFDDLRFDGKPEDETAEGREAVRRLLLCSGKVYYDIVGHTAFGDVQGIAVARLEQLYPFPVPAYIALLRRYPRLEQLMWVQEEPQNMGPYRSIRHRLEDSLPEGVALTYAGRPWRASSSEAYPSAHLIEQDRFVRAALGVAAR